jgi:hypothetical protein
MAADLAEPEPEIELLVPCMNQLEPPPVLRRLGPNDERPAILVINQCTTIDPPPPLHQPGLRMLSVRERGVGKSRNRLLEHARGKLLAFCDDDTELIPGGLDVLRRGFAANPHAGIVTFQFLERETGRPFKRYPAHGFEHGPLSIASVSAVEIALRRERAGHIRFDDRFGVGSKLLSGEENIWLRDALRAGVRASYFPEAYCDHPGLSSGYRPWTEDMAYAKGAMLKRMYPALWPALTLGFCVAKYPLYRASLSGPRFVSAAVRGALGFRP